MRSLYTIILLNILQLLKKTLKIELFLRASFFYEKTTTLNLLQYIE